MKTIGALRPTVDMLGVGMSVLCMVHCLAFPILVAFAPQMMRRLPGDDTTHRSLLVVIALLGCIAFRRGYQLHRKGWILYLFLLGAALVSLAAICGEAVLSAPGETAITVCGSLFIVSSHVLNQKYGRSCTCCDDPCLQELR